MPPAQRSVTAAFFVWLSLTPREAEVFRCTVAGLLNKQGAAELGIAQNTYQVHRGRVMRKMQADSLADLVRMSTRLELIFPIAWDKGSRSGALRNTVEGWTNRSAIGLTG